MLPDWFTVCAQIVNFLILVALLKRFLYRPVLDAIAKREQMVAAQVRDAEQMKAAAAQEKLGYQRQKDELCGQKEKWLREAENDVKEQREALLNEARRAAADLSERLKQSVEAERQTLSGEIVSLARRETLAIARQALHLLADAELEQRMGLVFASQLRALPEKERELWQASARESQELVVRSAWQLNEATQQVIQEAVRVTLGELPEMRFETNANVLGGVELCGNGRKLAWHLAEYLAGLKQKVEVLWDGAGGKDELITQSRSS